MSDATEQSRRTLIFAGGTLFCRVLGFLRDLTWILYIPAASRDAFLIAFRFPNMLRDLVGEGASNAAFVPVFSESIEKDSDEEYRELVSASMSAMLILLMLLTAMGLLVLPHILGNLDLLTPLTQRDAVPSERVTQMTQIALWTFPYLFLIGMTVFCMGPLFAAGRYAVPAWTPAILSVSIIGACIGLHDRLSDPAYAPVIGMWIGGIAQLAVQYVSMGRTAGVWLPNFRLNHPALKTIFFLLIPVIFGQAAGELNKLIDLLFAASLPIGTVTVLFYANRLVQLPLSIFGVATQVAILPPLARAAARGDTEAVRTQLMTALRQCTFLVLPAAVGLIVLAGPIVRLLFQYRHFSPEDAAKTATALTIYAVGLSAFALVKVAVTGFYAAQNTRIPVLIASGCMLLNILLNAAMVGPLGYAGLALASTIAFSLNFVLLYLFLFERYGRLWDHDFARALSRMVIASAMMAAIVYGTHSVLLRNIGDEAVWQRAATTIPPIVIGALAYLGLANALNVSEIKTFLSALQRKD